MGKNLFNDRGFLRFTPPVTAVVASIGVVALALGVDNGSNEVIAVGSVLIFVAAAGRYTTVRDDKYGGVKLARPAPARPAISDVVSTGRRRERVILRRRSGIANATFAMGVLWCLAVVLAPNEPTGYMIGFTIVAVAFLMSGILAGRVSRFVVTREWLMIDTAFRSVRMPRALVKSFAQTRNKVRLNLTNQQHLDFRVDSPIHDVLDKSRRRANPRTQVKTTERLVQIMDDMPIGPDQAHTVETRPRVWPLILSSAFGAVAFALTDVLATMTH